MRTPSIYGTLRASVSLGLLLISVGCGSTYHPGLTAVPVKKGAKQRYANGYPYWLPKTKVKIRVDVTKTIVTKGKFEKYAQRYGFKPKTPGTTVSVTGVEVETSRLRDKDHEYFVRLDRKTSKGLRKAMVELTELGYIVKGESEAADDRAATAVQVFKTLGSIASTVIGAGSALEGSGTATLSTAQKKEKFCKKINASGPFPVTCSVAWNNRQALIQAEKLGDESAWKKLSSKWIEYQQVKATALEIGTLQAARGTIIASSKFVTSSYTHWTPEWQDKKLAAIDTETKSKLAIFTGDVTISKAKVLIEHTPELPTPGGLPAAASLALLHVYSEDGVKAPLNINAYVPPALVPEGNSGTHSILILKISPAKTGVSHWADATARPRELLGLRYRIPEVATVNFTLGDQSFPPQEILISQFGRIGSLPRELPGTGSKMVFDLHPQTGALKSLTLTQESPRKAGEDVAGVTKQILEAQAKRQSSKPPAGAFFDSERENLEAERKYNEELVKSQAARDAVAAMGTGQ